jgi:hypothetical protein
MVGRCHEGGKAKYKRITMEPKRTGGTEERSKERVDRRWKSLSERVERTFSLEGERKAIWERMSKAIKDLR